MYKGSFSIQAGNGDTGKDTNLEFSSSHSAIEKLIPEVEGEPNRGGHRTNGNGSLSSRIYRENDVGRETKHSSVQPVGWGLVSNAQLSTHK